MVGSYHDVAGLARKTYEVAWGKQPAHRDALMLVRTHFEFNALAHAAIHFITNDSVDDAITKIMRERGMKKEQAKPLLTSSIERGPKAWIQNSDFLRSKGVVVVEGRCFILPAELRRDTPYDTAFKQLSPKARQIAEKAIVFALNHEKKDLDFSFGPLTQQYLVAQLMDEGTAKDFRITALSAQTPAYHQKQMTNSAYAARYFAKEVGVDLAGLNIVLREERPLETKPAEKKPATKPRAPSVGMAANLPFSATANDVDDSARKELRQALGQIIGQNGITRTHAQIYFYLSNISDGPVPTHEDASDKFGVKATMIPLIVKNVELALNSLRNPPQEQLTIKR